MRSPQSGRVERPVTHPLVDAIVPRGFQLVNRIADWRRRYPWAAHVAVFVASALVAHVIWRYPLEPVARHYGLKESSDHNLYPIVEWVAHGIVTAISFPVLSFFFQLLLIAQRGIAAHNLGLLWLSATGGDVQELLSWFVRQHPETDPIRIICISGERLFGNAVEGQTSPLRKWAESGRLDVVMPVSSRDNATIRERHRSYRGALKERYPTIPTLIAEIDRGKAFLRQNQNSLTEHDILCMWRVVILQNYCFVQNYFPNLKGQDSTNAPTFVYKNTGEDSYYQTYLEMFTLIKRNPGALHPDAEAEANTGASPRSRARRRRHR